MTGFPTSRPDASKRVVVAVLTYRRPTQLRRLLPALLDEATALASPADVVVIDNDPDRTAEAVVATVSAAVRYVPEPVPGIAAARNRAITEAGSADALVFIDDDELPGNGWLSALIDAWRRYDCAAVTGPVRADFAVAPPAWVRASGAFDRKQRPSGTRLRGAATNNLLLDLRTIRRLDLRFDDRFGLTGGEDTMFGHALVRRGGDIRWCDDAEVTEPVAPDRATRRWVLRRGFRAGTSWSAVELALARSAAVRTATRCSLTGRGLARIAVGAGQWLAGLVTGNLGRRARAEVELVSCAGMVLGAYGFRYREYRRR
jgi:glycosyltransferase involved in cell wall biosynthesis